MKTLRTKITTAITTAITTVALFALGGAMAAMGLAVMGVLAVFALAAIGLAMLAAPFMHLAAPSEPEQTT